jgi:hypothetical protein
MEAPKRATALVVGSLDDPHATAVATQLESKGITHLVLDVASLAGSRFVVEPHSTRISKPAEQSIEVGAGVRGWLRRIAPDGWQRGVPAGSRQSAVATAWMSLLGSIVRYDGIEWLTAPDSAFAAENKLVQYRAAQRLSIRVPTSIVAADKAEVTALLGDRFLIKPLGPGQFFEGSDTRAVFAGVVTVDDPTLQDLAGAPFIAQRLIRADRHLRVVTVRDRAWVCALDAVGLDVDWRRIPAAHGRCWRVYEPDVAAAAVHLADALKVGYSSQDWVEQDGQKWFLDLNPAGQWLFLPDRTGEEVAEAIATWLAGRS